MKKHVCLAIAISLLAVLPAEAQQASGTYLTSVAGQTITETYTVSVEPDGALKAEAEITIQGSKRKVITRIANVVTGGAK